MAGFWDANVAVAPLGLASAVQTASHCACFALHDGGVTARLTRACAVEYDGIVLSTLVRAGEVRPLPHHRAPTGTRHAA
jgi:hypothetical protein